MKPPLLQRLPVPSTSRTLARDATLTALARFHQGSTRRRLLTPRTHFIYLHFLPAEQEGTLRRLILELRKTHEIVSYSDAVGRVHQGTPIRPAVAFSFDDGFKSNVRAAKLLAEEDVSACFFLCSGLMARDIDTVRAAYSGAVGSESGTINWSDSEEILDLGHEIGSHTRTHATLSTISDEQAAEEIQSSKAGLEERLGPIDHFAWPRGQRHHINRPRDVDFVYSSGYRSMASAVRGTHISTEPDNKQVIYREHYDTSWPIEHLLYFLGRSVNRATRSQLPEL